MAAFFVNAGLLWGLALVGLPVLIHLINLFRQRRVPWAAMEFLLQSQKKHRTWVKLKEWLLLLLRMAAIAAVVMIVAQPLTDASTLLNMFGQKTEHIILLDDSYSMSDRWGGRSAFERAKEAVTRIAQQAAADSKAQQFTLWRYSQAGLGTAGRADLDDAKVPKNFGDTVADLIKSWQPSSLSTGPSYALEAVLARLGAEDGRNRIIYVVSDFRSENWDSPQTTLDKLARLQALPASLIFVQTIDTQRANATISALEPAEGIIAAGVPFGMQVTVTNHSSTPLKNVSVLLEEDGNGRPALQFDLVPAGESVTHRFPVSFATAGEHIVTARLPSDTIEVDNVRQRVLHVPLVNPVLIIEGRDDSGDGQFLQSIFSPGGNIKTGVEPIIERPSWLNQNSLDRFSTVFLTNLDRLDPAAIRSLEKFAQGGGGVIFFLGENCRADFFNPQVYRDGEGCFPLPLLAPTQLLVDRLDKGADIQVVLPNHPLFRFFAGERNTFLSSVTIERFFAAPKSWQPDPQSSTQIIATLRNGSPLAVERRFGQGHVVAITTTAGPSWNNWGRNPSFVVAMLELQSYLIAQRLRGDDLLAGVLLERVIERDKYQPRARFVPPPGSGIESVSADLADTPQGLHAAFPDTSAAGVYELQLTTLDNAPESRRFALNVDPAEGDLAILDTQQLASRLPGIQFKAPRAEQFSLIAGNSDRANLSDLLLYGLVALLVGEQALAYAVSYHPAPLAKGHA